VLHVRFWPKAPHSVAKQRESEREREQERAREAQSVSQSGGSKVAHVPWKTGFSPAVQVRQLHIRGRYCSFQVGGGRWAVVATGTWNVENAPPPWTPRDIWPKCYDSLGVFRLRICPAFN